MAARGGFVQLARQHLIIQIDDHYLRAFFPDIEGKSTYSVSVCGAERADRSWEGWLEFYSIDGAQPTYVPIRRPASPTSLRRNVGLLGFSQFTLKVRWPVPKVGCRNASRFRAIWPACLEHGHDKNP